MIRQIACLLLVVSAYMPVSAGELPNRDSTRAGQTVVLPKAILPSDTTIVNLAKVGGKIEIISNDEPIDRYLPWVSALLVGLASVFVSWLIGVRQAKVAKEQVQTSIGIAREQLEQANSMTLQTLKANIVSANRQNWINELRDLSAKYISGAGAIVTECIQQERATGKIVITENVQEIFRDMNYCKAKIELMLNYNEPICLEIAKNLHDMTRFQATETFEGLSDDINLLSSNLRVLFKSEWEKIKQLS